MKAIENIIKRIWIIVVLAVVVTACYDEFDPKSYMPTFTISGFSSVDQIEPAALVSYWSFDEGSGSIAHDRSGHANDGMLSGNPTWISP